MNKVKTMMTVCLFAGIVFTKLHSNQEKSYSDIILSNIEALATEEGNQESNMCTYAGSIKCSTGGYAKIIINKIEDDWLLF